MKRLALLYKKIKNILILIFIKDKSQYTANKVLLFTLLTIFLFSLLIGDKIKRPALQIENNYVQRFYLALVEPLADLSRRLHTADILPVTRRFFLRLTELEKAPQWEEDFFYDNPQNSHADSVSNAEKHTDSEDKKGQTKSDSEIPTAEKIKSFAKQDAVIPAGPQKETIPAEPAEKETPPLQKEEPEIKPKQEKEPITIKEKKQESPPKKESGKKQQQQKKELTLKQTPQQKQTPKIQKPAKLSPHIVRNFSPNTETADTGADEFSASHPLRILMIGDSQMRYLAGGALRILGTDSDIRIDEISVLSSGFIRTDYYNWPKKLETLFAAQKNKTAYGAAIVILGMNDNQSFYLYGKPYEPGTAEWEKRYKKRIKNHLDVLLTYVPKVYLLGMPKVRNKEYDKTLHYIEKMQQEVVKEYDKQKVECISLTAIAPGKNALYMDMFQTPSGNKIQLMNTDGMHYTFSGGKYIMQEILQKIRKDFRFKKKDKTATENLKNNGTQN
ncbi:DUF459 domain-containing protein [Treponema phagedenis]|uniref:DUF459 domain-containing protein n=1 Tax=Treponema phagedenis TaxID=162 RepID=A0A0B7GZG4_TREPH|nr:DUF459 domain-containing protein [Treponema phagedenis]NVP24277.1 DUF459 domain-containing protein [Treponema phagedenis]QEJ94248.1 DUF459 domain-containing protein [Treponema phagedenis]QEJ99126.1 DUF459 domain-containing protein [Treponema phagedenis]QEK00206.1 DUF459 domain-containing protein [Treponema phagedenis]QEK04654.1 DUF459 domain-containing protein [Treponema phagedenis]